MGKGWTIEREVTVELSDFEDSAVKSYCMENKIVTAADFHGDALEKLIQALSGDTPINILVQKIRDENKMIITKRDLKAFFCDYVDNMVISMVD